MLDVTHNLNMQSNVKFNHLHLPIIVFSNFRNTFLDKFAFSIKKKAYSRIILEILEL